MKYERFEIHLETTTLHHLAQCIRNGLTVDVPPLATSELKNLACEVEARLQKIATPPSGCAQKSDDWLL